MSPGVLLQCTYDLCVEALHGLLVSLIMQSTIKFKLLHLGTPIYNTTSFSLIPFLHRQHAVAVVHVHYKFSSNCVQINF